MSVNPQAQRYPVFEALCAVDPDVVRFMTPIAISWESIPDNFNNDSIGGVQCKPAFVLQFVEFIDASSEYSVGAVVLPLPEGPEMQQAKELYGPTADAFYMAVMVPEKAGHVYPQRDRAIIFAIKSDGTPVMTVARNGKPQVMISSPYALSPAEADAAASFVGCVLFVFALMHCKNIRVEEQPLARAYRRQQAKAGNVVDAVRVRTLQIVPFSVMRKEESSNARNGIGYTPLHVVRGHFATYTEARKLFGRFVGTVWVAQHNRGSRAFGEVRKRYVVAPTDDLLPGEAA